MMQKFAFIVGITLAIPVALAQSSGNRTERSADPCYGNPCGPNSRCSYRHGRAVCQCHSGYYQRGGSGCYAECHYDHECPSHQRCDHGRCINSCINPPTCGINAECQAINNKAVCMCPHGHEGDPLIQCHRKAKAIDHYPKFHEYENPCSRNPCGTGAICRNSGYRAICECPPGYFGNSGVHCRRGECQSDHECPHSQICENYKCINPCFNKCGTNAKCDVRNHIVTCSCPTGFTGNPTIHCRSLSPGELCLQSCGPNTDCSVQHDRVICKCKPGFVGTALAPTGCRHECESDYDCAHGQSCENFKCANPCHNKCGQQAKCEVVNHRAVCSCPQHYLGDPHVRCYPECTSHGDCGYHQFCGAGLRCEDACLGKCGVNAHCEARNHQAICSCPTGFRGDARVQCTPDPVRA